MDSSFVIFEQIFAKKSFHPTGSSRLLQVGGKTSYGLYMLHFTALYIINKLPSLLHWNHSLWQVLLLLPMLGVILSVVLARLSYQIFEGPFLKVKNRFSIVLKADHD